MTAKEVFDIITANQGCWIFLILTIVQIAPIKLNPWTVIFKWFGRAINGELFKKFDTLEKELQDVKREFEVKNANDKRWDILDFSNSCRNGRKHGREEWEHVIDQLKQYETYVKEHKIDNGVIEEETRYLRALYRERLEKNDFL